MSDDPEIIREVDVDWLAELREQDEEAEGQLEAIRDVAACCHGVDPTCGHYGFYVPRRQIYWDEP